MRRILDKEEVNREFDRSGTSYSMGIGKRKLSRKLKNQHQIGIFCKFSVENWR
jgi:hypothetical protein